MSLTAFTLPQLYDGSDRIVINEEAGSWLGEWSPAAVWRCTPARRVRGLRTEFAVSVEDPTHIHTSHWKKESDPFVASSVHRTPAQKSQRVREGRSLQREGRSPVFQWDVWIGVGSATRGSESCFSVGCVDWCWVFHGDSNSLRNPGTRCTPSYIS